MERSNWVRRRSLLQLATIVAILSLVTMHTPEASHAMPTSHNARVTMSASHMNGSACRALRQEAATTPAVIEQPPVPPVASAIPDAQVHDHDHAFHSLDQTTLSIWRT